jgi:hypothetical protein
MIAPTIATMVVPFLVGTVGLIIYFASTNPKISESGRIAYFTGLLWLIYLFARNIISF